MAMANMNLIGVFVTKLWPVQALACGGGDGGDGGAGVIGSDVPWLECPACNGLTWVITVTE